MVALPKKIISFITHALPLPEVPSIFGHIQERQLDSNDCTSEKIINFITNVKMSKTADKTLWEQGIKSMCFRLTGAYS